MQETYYSRLTRLQAEEREHARAMYGWVHPDSIAWAEARKATGIVSLRSWCRHLENRVADLEARLKRQRAAVLPEQPQAADEQRHEAAQVDGERKPAISISWGRRNRG